MNNPTVSEPFDDTAKEFYRKLFEEWGLSVETEREVFFKGRAIDLVVKCTQADQQQLLQSTRFAHFKRLNALEFKGINDPLTLVDYNKIMMRVWGLGALSTDKKEDSHLNQLPSQRTLTIICVTKPNKILQLTEEFHFYPTSEPGIYHCATPIAQWLIYPTELELNPINYLLLPLSRGKKLQAFVDLCFEQNLLDHLLLILSIGAATNPISIWRKIMETGHLDLEEEEYENPHVDHSAAIPYIECYFETHPDILARLAITNRMLEEKLQEGIQQGIQQGIQKGIQKGVQKGVQQGIQQGVQKGILQGMQKGMQEGMRQGMELQIRKILLRYLDNHLSYLPEVIAQRIEKTDDLEQLENWLEEVMAIKHLTETEVARIINH